MTTLSDQELAALDFIIESKRAGALPAGFIDIANIVNDANNLVNNVGNAAEAVAAVTAAAAAVAAVAGGAIVSPAISAAPLAAPVGGTPGSGVSLDLLLEIRKQALSAKKTDGQS